MRDLRTRGEGKGSTRVPERPCAGESAGKRSRLQTGTTRPGRGHRVGVTSDGAENAPRLRVTCGEDSNESVPPLKHRVEHTPPALRIAQSGSLAMAFSRSE